MIIESNLPFAPFKTLNHEVEDNIKIKPIEGYQAQKRMS